MEAVAGAVATLPGGVLRVVGPAEITVRSTAGDAVALSLPLDDDSWSTSTDGRTWTSARARYGEWEPPHSRGESLVDIELTHLGAGLYELAAPALGRPLVTSATAPQVSSGESIAEARYAGIPENRTDVVEVGAGLWTTRHELAVRHLVVSGDHIEDVAFRARVRPGHGSGAFACSDERLTRIWTGSALTLRLCMQGLVIDGLKRDRMPWIGDQALNTISNSFAFGDAQIVRDGLIALGRPSHGYVNGIADYSLWWLINARHLVSHLGDTTFAIDHPDLIADFVGALATYAGEDGLFRPDEQDDGFIGTGAGSVFIDWGVVNDLGRTSVPLQMLWRWALVCAADLLEATDPINSLRWRGLADRARAALRDSSWDAEAGLWADGVGEPGSTTPYANFLSLLSGVHDGDATPEMIAAIRDCEQGTPFMRGFALMALARAGHGQDAIREISRRWGGMLDAGAVTFWEEFTADGESPYEMYGRPYAKSLCHAWSSGPAALLPQILLGLEPLEDGWRTFAVAPELGDLAWAAAVIPTSRGDIAVYATPDEVTTWIPAGTRAHVAGRVHHGPARVVESIESARMGLPQPSMPR